MPLFLLLVLPLLLLTGCSAQRSRPALRHQDGESVVLASQTPGHLAFEPALSRPIDVRSTYCPSLPETIHYQPGRDYLLNAAGEITRTPTSRIPDFSTNILYSKTDFDHTKFPGFGNKGFFVYADYFRQVKWKPPTARPEFGRARLPNTLSKLKAGQPVRIVAFGDSITAGADAADPNLVYWQRWADALRQKYPRAAIEVINGATGGDATTQGLQRLDEKVLQQKPDLVLVAFGMNDHNVPNFGVAPELFAHNLSVMIDRIRAAGAEVLLLSTFPPNPKWRFGSHRMGTYAELTEQVAREKQSAYADVYHYWLSQAARKNPEDLLANNINHPNEFGHWIYLQALLALDL